jgi:hypothetical protein
VNQGDAGFEVEGAVLGLNHVNWRKTEKELKGEGSRISEKWVEMSINGPRWGGNLEDGLFGSCFQNSKTCFCIVDPDKREEEKMKREKMSGTLVPL